MTRRIIELFDNLQVSNNFCLKTQFRSPKDEKLQDLRDNRRGCRTSPIYFPIAVLLTIILASYATASCASAPTTPASWDAAPAAIRDVFPDSDYIAQRGRGATRAAAETSAAAELARFISSQVSANRGYEITTNGETENVSTRDEAYVQTQIDLFGIRYADDAYYRADIKEWRTVAYIERAEAWAVYSPRFKQQADAFTSLYNAAENESDPFKKTLRLIAADNFTRGGEFQSASLFGQILSPERMNAEFAAVRAASAAIPQRLDEARRAASVYIDCPLDFESMVGNAFASRFAALGFPVSRSRDAAAAICHITIDEGYQKRDIGDFYYPSLRAEITGAAGTLLTFNAQGEKSAAVTADVAKRRAYESLANAVTKTFSLETAGI